MPSFFVRFNAWFHVEYGNSVYITGSGDVLGNWNIEKAIPLKYLKDDIWTIDVEFPLTSEDTTVEYKYFYSHDGKQANYEPESNHILRLAPIKTTTIIETLDTIHWTDIVQNAYNSAPFSEVINKPKEIIKEDLVSPEGSSDDLVAFYINVRCPYVRKNQHLLISGSCSSLGEWSPEKAIPLANENFPDWSARILLPRSEIPFSYKFILSSDNGEYFWENASNRHIESISAEAKVFVRNEWLVSPNPEFFKGLGIYVPLFSLRTKRSQGIGSYTDLRELVDCCNAMGASLIQLLPINDTTNNGTWTDSYPYKQVSCFALSPSYIDLYEAIDSLPKEIKAKIDAGRTKLDELKEIDFPSVYAFKMGILKEIFASIKAKFSKSKELSEFIKKNASWLNPYVLFCHFRDKFGKMRFREWPEHSKIDLAEIESLCSKHKEDLLFYYWLQYVADKQFADAVAYAKAHSVVFKGDLPIGVNIDSVECWAFPNLFRLHMCAGAPPDEFSSDGQNWGFPTYDWDAMEKDNFSWWRTRLARMAELYQCLRVDHILGFYRIWEIPRSTCVRGLLGHFFPACPLSRDELNGWGLWDINRYVRPYIRFHILEQKFGSRAAEVAERFLKPLNYCYPDDWFEFKPEYDSEHKIQNAIQADTSIDKEWANTLLNGLWQLIGNVLLIEDPENPGMYHVRTEVAWDHVDVDENGSPVITWSSSLLELPENQRAAMGRLYDEFTYKRNTHLWCQKADAKINMLKNATKLLVCGEDLGQITEGIVNHLSHSGLLSLRVQRMSKDPKFDFDNHHDFPYMGVACPSTHDTSSLRGWWEEDRSVIAKFWYNVLGRHDEVPRELDSHTQTDIVSQNLWSNAMWAVFLLQDLTSCVDDLRLQTPAEERINVPSNPDHHWCYRYPFSLEELRANKNFNEKIFGLARSSHRI